MMTNPYYQGGPGWQKRSREHPHDHGTTGDDAAYGQLSKRQQRKLAKARAKAAKKRRNTP
jgi:hypothetical protein